MKIRSPDPSPTAQDDSFGEMGKKFTPLDKQKAAISRGKKMKNKANSPTFGWKLEILNTKY